MSLHCAPEKGFLEQRLPILQSNERLGVLFPRHRPETRSCAAAEDGGDELDFHAVCVTLDSGKNLACILLRRFRVLEINHTT